MSVIQSISQKVFVLTHFTNKNVYQAIFFTDMNVNNKYLTRFNRNYYLVWDLQKGLEGGKFVGVAKKLYIREEDKRIAKEEVQS